MKKGKEKHYTWFKGARLNERDANRTGVGIIFGLLGMGLAFNIAETHYIRLLIITIVAGIGFFLVGPALFKNKKK